MAETRPSGTAGPPSANPPNGGPSQRSARPMEYMFTADEWRSLVNESVSEARLKELAVRAVQSEVSRASLARSAETDSQCSLKCASCTRPVTYYEAKKRKVIYALNRLWHREHFACDICNAAIGTSRLEFRPHGLEGNVPICTDCYARKFHPKCATCDKPLYDTCIEFGGQQYHRTCLVCAKCHSAIPEGELYQLDGKIYDCDCFHLTKYRSVLQHAPPPPPPPPPIPIPDPFAANTIACPAVQTTLTSSSVTATSTTSSSGTSTSSATTSGTYTSAMVATAACSTTSMQSTQKSDSNTAVQVPVESPGKSGPTLTAVQATPPAQTDPQAPTPDSGGKKESS